MSNDFHGSTPSQTKLLMRQPELGDSPYAMNFDKMPSRVESSRVDHFEEGKEMNASISIEESGTALKKNIQSPELELHVNDVADLRDFDGMSQADFDAGEEG